MMIQLAGADSSETVGRFGNAERRNLIFTPTNLVIIDKAPHVLIYRTELKAKRSRSGCCVVSHG